MADGQPPGQAPEPGAAAPPRRRRGPSRGVKIAAVVVASLFVVGVLGAIGTVVGVFWYYGRSLDDLDQERLKNYRPPQITRVLSRDGELIGEVFTQRRTFIDYEDIPSHVENAFLAAEDADFYQHEGMDYMGMARALVTNLQAGEIKQGASTITQQVVKNFILTPERSFERKVQELILARRLEQALTKKQILELYLNEIYLGHGRYGIEEASRYYFGKSVRDIDVGQAAMLATLPKAPGRDSPYKSPERAKNRQIYVLRQMVEHGFLPAVDAQVHIEAPLEAIVVDSPREAAAVVAGGEEFVDAAKRILLEHYGEDDLAHMGATVWTTVDLEIQGKARAGLRKALEDLDARQHHGRALEPAKPKALAKARKVEGPLKVGHRYSMIVQARPSSPALPPEAVAGTIGETPVMIRVPDGSRFREADKTLAEQFPVDAIVKVFVTRLPTDEPPPPPKEGAAPRPPAGWAEAEIRGPEAAVVVGDAETGDVLAMVGGYDYALAQLNRAMQSKRQPGSSFKPFVYGAAIAQRSPELTAASLISDSPEIYDKWKPTNYERDVYRGDIRMRLALTKSVNTVAIKLLDRVGFENVHAFAHAAGIETELPEHLSLALGTTEVYPYEMMRAYMTLARGGSRVEPRLVTKVEIGGHVDWEPVSEPEQALPADAVFVLTSMMTSVVQAGTGAKAKALGRPVAGKTGTSAEAQDAWFAGFTPQRVAVAWVGFDRPRPLGRGETGGRAAIPVWLAAMEAASDGEVRDFSPPPNVSVRRIDEASGLLAPTVPPVDPETGEPLEMGPTLEEYFLEGTEPIEEATAAALPPGDVLLDLYGESAEVDADETEIDLGATPSGPDAPEGPPPDDGALPSLDSTALVEDDDESRTAAQGQDDAPGGAGSELPSLDDDALRP